MCRNENTVGWPREQKQEGQIQAPKMAALISRGLVLSQILEAKEIPTHISPAMPHILEEVVTVSSKSDLW